MPDDSNLPLRALLLGGTVALPTPFPTIGSLREVSEKDAHKYLGERLAIKLVVIEHTIEPSTQIQRIVRRDRIRAIFKPDDPENVGFHQGTWTFPGEGYGGEVPTQGIVFIPEDEPIMTRVIFSGTAAESAEYRPPTHRDGCDGDVKNGCDRAIRNGCDVV